MRSRGKYAGWQKFAAATSSALALSTSAAAGIIYNTANVTVNTGQTQDVHFDSGWGDFRLQAESKAALLQGGLSFRGNGGYINRFYSGTAAVGGGSATFIAKIVGSSAQGNFQASQTGFAGFQFNDSQGQHFGWARIEFTVSGSSINSLTLIDYAYNSAVEGGILVGQETDSVPEPGTKALSVLATGAAGIWALRRFRKQQTA